MPDWGKFNSLNGYNRLMPIIIARDDNDNYQQSRATEAPSSSSEPFTDNNDSGTHYHIRSRAAALPLDI